MQNSEIDWETVNWEAFFEFCNNTKRADYGSIYGSAEIQLKYSNPPPENTKGTKSHQDKIRKLKAN